MKKREYELIAVFLVDGISQYIVKTPGGVSILPENEYRNIIKYAERFQHQ